MCVFVPAGCVCLRSELPDVHPVGVTLLLPGRHTGQSLRSVRMRLRNTRGKTATRCFSFTHLHFHVFHCVRSLFLFVRGQDAEQDS